MIGNWGIGIITDAPNPGSSKIRQIHLKNSTFLSKNREWTGRVRVGWNKRGNCMNKKNIVWSFGKELKREACYRGYEVGHGHGHGYGNGHRCQVLKPAQARRKNRGSHQESHRELQGMVTRGSMGGNDLKPWLLLESQNELISFIFFFHKKKDCIWYLEGKIWSLFSSLQILLWVPNRTMVLNKRPMGIDLLSGEYSLRVKINEI